MKRSYTGITTGYQFGQCMVSQMGATFAYDHEYLGPTPRLIFTPLTERAYLTLTLAMSSFACGTLIGPSGTGKSETIKDLAKVKSNEFKLLHITININLLVLLNNIINMYFTLTCFQINIYNTVTGNRLGYLSMRCHLSFQFQPIKLRTENSNEYRYPVMTTSE